jgi:nicotinate-nucleotide pyrophosphorylase (carboxylating)
MRAEQPDRVALVTAAMRALLDDDVRPSGDPDAVGTARIVCDRAGRVAGLALMREVFGRLGVRSRLLVRDGTAVAPGDVVAEVGGPVAAIRAGAPTALRLLHRLSAVASGELEPAAGDPVEAFAATLRLSAHDPVGHDGPSFRLEMEGKGS